MIHCVARVQSQAFPLCRGDLASDMATKPETEMAKDDVYPEVVPPAIGGDDPPDLGDHSSDSAPSDDVGGEVAIAVVVTPQDAAGRCPADLERHVRRIASEVVSRLRGAAPAATDSAAAAAAPAPPTCLVPAIGGAQIAGGSDDFPDLGDDHSSPQADAAPPVPGGMSTMDELAILNEIESWQKFRNIVASTLSCRRRFALAYHTTTACQPKKAVAPANHSLVECGLPAIGGDRPDELIEVAVNIPHAYEVGDNLRLTYQCCGTPQEVENKVCLDLLCFLLVSSPHKVLLHPNTMRHGDQSVSTIRETAELVHQEYLQRCQQIPCQPLAAWVQHPLPRRPPAPSDLRSQAVAQAGFTLQDKLEAFDHLAPGVWYHFEQSKVQGKRKLPPVCRQELSVKLEKGGLLSFLQQFPHIFEVVFTGERTAKSKPKYEFSLGGPTKFACQR